MTKDLTKYNRAIKANDNVSLMLVYLYLFLAVGQSELVCSIWCVQHLHHNTGSMMAASRINILVALRWWRLGLTQPG